MRSHVCGGEIQNTITDLPFKLSDHRILVVKSPPVEQCSSCGEYLLSDHVTQDLEDMIESTFGSYAWGTPHEDSDLDLFVIVHSSDQPAYRRARAIYRCLRDIAVPVDVIVQTHDEVARSSKVVASLARKVLEQGRVLYGSTMGKI